MLNSIVALNISWHYFPRHAGDTMPELTTGAAGTTQTGIYGVSARTSETRFLLLQNPPDGTKVFKATANGPEKRQQQHNKSWKLSSTTTG